MGSKGFKKWTDEETMFLTENWGRKTCEGIAKKLGRTVRAVRARASYVGLGAAFDAEAHLTLTAVYKALYGHNPDVKSINRLMRNGFPVQERIFNLKRYRLVDPEKMWTWLKAHQEEFDFVRLEEYSLGAEPQWVRDKRKADWKKHNEQRWGLTN